MSMKSLGCFILWWIPFWMFGQIASYEAPLLAWDSIRGSWLVECSKALSEQRIIPDRTFPEDFTPFELMTVVPLETRQILQAKSRENTQEQGYVQQLQDLVNATFCTPIQGRSYGDPHIVTLDQTAYSFQTVGEFVVTKSGANFEVQARQKPQNNDFSLNTAVAVQLYGDRICYYAEDIPDGSIQPIWLNGAPIQLHGRTYYLPHGGTLRLVGKNYILAGPKGERIILDVRSGSNKLINLTVELPSCQHSVFHGLLGNGNGNSMDEFQTNRQNNALPWGGFVAMNAPGFASIGEDLEQRYQNQIIKEYAELYRVNRDSSLFDYRPGLTTDFYTDRSFPRVIRTFASIPEPQRDAARKRCQAMGVSEAEMNGCVFDVHYLNLTPNPVPAPPAATDGVIIDRMRHPLVNTNTVVPNKIPDSAPLPLHPSAPGELNPSHNEVDKAPHATKPIFSFPEIKPSKVGVPTSQPAKPITSKPITKEPASVSPLPSKTVKGKN